VVSSGPHMQQYAFFPGCLARVKLPQIERSVRWILTDLGIGLKDQPRFTCCPDPVVFRSASRSEWLRLAARNLALDSDLPILTICPGCASSLSEARHILIHDSQVASRVESQLGQIGLKMSTPVVLHFLKLLWSPEVSRMLAQRVSKSLEGLRVACHYGCHLVRPSFAVAFDDPEKPTSLDQVVRITGAETVDYQDKYMCCGRPSMDETTSTAIARHKLQCMKEAGCDLLVVACPFCFEQFDLGQVVIQKREGLAFEILVLYVTQLVGLAMGRNSQDLGLDLHRIKLTKVL
jgi:heterodisulfide reductase subunit B